MNSGKAVLGILAGVAAGAMLGILFAPDKGSVTRKTISNKGSDTLDELKDKLDELVKTVNEKFAKGSAKADEFANTVKTKAEAIKDAAIN